MVNGPPEVSKIGPYDYTIHGDGATFEAMCEECGFDSEEVFGITEAGKGVISLNPEICIPQRRVILTHEHLHALWDASGLVHEARFDDDMEEQVVTRLAPWLLMLIQDNPKLIEYLQRKGKE